jgi:2-polyprenyl-3-methyl-5-hydroxy-6-metoxy-1,4-benzoquinol methylase
MVLWESPDEIGLRSFYLKTDMFWLMIKLILRYGLNRCNFKYKSKNLMLSLYNIANIRKSIRLFQIKTVEMTKQAYGLNDLVKTYNIDNDYEQFKRLEFIEKLEIYTQLEGRSVLEFGPASGQMTKILAERGLNIVAVDGSSEFISIAKKKLADFNNVTFVESYFEDFNAAEKFDILILHHILEHIENPLSFLRGLKSHLKYNGLLVLSVPNAMALSRQLAVNMGLLESVYSLTENDIHHGHFRVYDWGLLEDQISEAGFQIIGKHGLSFKLFSDKQNISMIKQKIIGESQLKGLWSLGDKYPDLAGAIMIVAKLQ